MRQSPLASPSVRGPDGSQEKSVIKSESAMQDVLDVLDDPDCRTILDATSNRALTAGEISEECDLAQSTAYRKLDLLAETALLEERTRIRQSGQHTSEYIRCSEDVVITHGTSGGMQLEILPRKTSSDQSTDSLSAAGD